MKVIILGLGGDGLTPVNSGIGDITASYYAHCPQITELSGMSDFKKGDRVVVLRLDSDEIECRGRYAGESGLIISVLVDDDELPDPIEVGADRVFPEKGQRERQSS